MAHKILVIGATSSIAQATLKLWAKRNSQFFLVGRNELHLQAISQDLKTQYNTSCEYFSMDLNDFSRLDSMLDSAYQMLGQIDIVLIAHGKLPNQAVCEKNLEQTLAEFSTNALSVIAILTLLANRLEAQKSGVIAVISSVAGDRGRQSNYVYGSAKALVTSFLSGMRQRLHRRGVIVITIKPGMVETPMTAH